MTLSIEYLTELRNNALKEQNVLTKEALSALIGNIKKAAIDKGCRDNITEELIIEVIRKEQKILKEQIETCPSDRPSLYEEYTFKLHCLNELVPALITDKGQIHDLVIDLCKDIEFNIKNKGIIMRTISTNLKGKVDMRVVQEVVSELMR